MPNFVVLLHIIAAVLFLGPVAVATSLYHVRALEASKGDAEAKGAAKMLHQITKTYGLLSLAVPLLGIAALIADWATLKTHINFHISIILALAAWAVLFFVILPKQKKSAAALGIGDEPAQPGTRAVNHIQTKKQLSMFAGIFNALWLVTAILMFF